ncbi:MAG: DNA recombination/repair protein RecA, partial [Anaerolineales bacterium]|nr:DNA recombination/repair protein RecA [Anaerolineales bacterium]
IMYNEGIAKVGDILDLGVKMELITKRGSFYSYGETRLGQGRENAKNFLRENPDMASEIEVGIREDAGLEQVNIEDSDLEDDKPQLDLIETEENDAD